MVVDTPVILAILFKERHAVWASGMLDTHKQDLKMSTVNLAEILILVQDKQPHDFEDIKAKILSSTIQFIPPTVEQSVVAAAARLRFPLNLGDCFAYALAKEEGCPLITLDRDFKNTDIEVMGPGH